MQQRQQQYRSINHAFRQSSIQYYSTLQHQQKNHGSSHSTTLAHGDGGTSIVSLQKSMHVLRNSNNNINKSGRAYFSTEDNIRIKGYEEYDLSHPECNITQNIASRVGTNLHLQHDHPLNTIKTKIENYWQQQQQQSTSTSTSTFETRDDIEPIVHIDHNFDSLLIPPTHVSRSRSDTYYLTNEKVLRTHTSAHQTTLLREGIDRFLVTGDVYRRDEIDCSHYPIFHQMEGVRMFTEQEFIDAGVVVDVSSASSSSSPSSSSSNDKLEYVTQDLKKGLEGMVQHLFGDVEMRWGDDYFPFTEPSFELEIYFNNEWLEVLGCGVVHTKIVQSVGRGDQLGWAFGLGLERLAMILFSIPDIRLFWTQDERFHSQFRNTNGQIVTFVPYSKYPPCFKDISFWTNKQKVEEEEESTFHVNDLNEVVRDIAGDLVERVELIDEFVHPKTGRTSHCYRISYRSMDRSLTNEEIDNLQEDVRRTVVDKLGVEIR